ncbi:MAG: hypothetical protein J7L82_00325, partial [Staphylothermus sp.]|nr:hypothetical protein [Staphylothermus sp.]
MPFRNYKLLLIIFLLVVVLYSVAFLYVNYYILRGSSAESSIIVNIDDVKDAEKIASTLLDKYWSESNKVWVYSFDIYWFKKDIMMDIMTKYY